MSNPNYHLELDENTLKVIGDALLELPAKYSLHTINEMNRQIAKQIENNKHEQPKK